MNPLPWLAGIALIGFTFAGLGFHADAHPYGFAARLLDALDVFDLWGHP